MKKQLATMAILCAIAFTSNAQTEKGQNLIGGAIGYNTSKQSSPLDRGVPVQSGDYKSFSISPRYGHFFSKNLVIGLSAGYLTSKSTINSNGASGGDIYSYTSTVKYHQFNVGPYLRYYVDIVDKFKFFGEFNASIGFGKNNNTINHNSLSTGVSESSSSNKSTIYNTTINPGFAFFPTKKWAIEVAFPLISYNKQNNKSQLLNSGISASSEVFSFGFNSFSPSIGLNYHF
nr:hypothetical protein [Pedobacter sp. ASV2]